MSTTSVFNMEIDDQGTAYQTGFALKASKYVAWGAGIDAVLQIALWLCLPKYPQLLAVGILTALLALIARLYPVFHRRGKEMLGRYVFLGGLVLVALAVPCLQHEVMLATTTGYLVIIVASYLLLGDKGGRWMIAICGIAFCINVIVISHWTGDWFPPLPEDWSLAVSMLISTFVLVFVALVIRMVFVEQERLWKALKQSNTELEQFAYVASHDLQEPLRMVASYVNLLERRNKDKLDSNSKEFIDFAVDGATRMQQLINDLLMYSRVGTRGKPFVPTECEAVYKKAIKNLEISIVEHKAKVTRDDLPQVMADERQLVQLFQNLIGNALKFCKDRTPEVHVSAKQERNNWIFGIHDNGIGIAPEHQERVLQVFQRLHSREEYKGTGIGLAVCKKIVERHGSKIWMESEVGKGTTFYFTMKGE